MMGCLFQNRKDAFDVIHCDTRKKPDPEPSSRPVESTKSCMVWRYYIATLGFISGLLVNMQRMGMAIAMVNMVNFTSQTSAQHNFSISSCPIANTTTKNSTLEDISQTGGEFDWSPQLQGFILGGNFLGYAISPILSGRLVDRFGCKVIMFSGNIVSAVGLLLYPICSWWHAYSLVLMQMIRGIAQGFTLPATFVMMAKWTPRGERGFISSFILTGYFVGSVVGGLVAGAVCETPSLGWEGLFYILGAVGVLFSILFGLTFYETPNDHPRISKSEIKHITEGQVSDVKNQKPPTPWLKIFTSVSTYALMIGITSFYWTIFYFLSSHPSYLHNVLNYSTFQSGFLSSIPFIMKILASLGSSAFADWLYRRKYVGVDKLRKGCTFIGCLGFSLSMLGLYLAKCSEVLNILFMATALMSSGIITPGAAITAVDMSPNFAGSLSGVTGTFASLVGFIIPVLVGYLAKDQTMDGWHNVFLVNIGVVMTAGIVFAVFGSANVQPWNFVEEESTKSGAKFPAEVEKCTVSTDAKETVNSSKL